MFFWISEAFAVCENYSPPEGFNQKDLYHLLEKVGTPCGSDNLGVCYHHSTPCLSCLNLELLPFKWIPIFNVKKVSCFWGNCGSIKIPFYVTVNLSFFFTVLLSWPDCSSGWLEGANKVYIPFLACGDLNGYDSDRSYPLPSSVNGSSYQSLDPVQPPIAPPYKTAIELKKASSHGIVDIEKLSLWFHDPCVLLFQYFEDIVTLWEFRVMN